MNFNWNEFEKGKITVCCRAEEETLDFLNSCEERGYEIDENITICDDEYYERTKNYLFPRLIPPYSPKYFNYSVELQRVIYSLDDNKLIDWEFLEPYRIYELEEGKTYITKRERFNSNPKLYKVKGNELLYYNTVREKWEEYLIITYNTIKNEIFIEFKEREINWYKVPRGTKVQVRDKEEDKWENRYLVFANNYDVIKGVEITHSFVVSKCLDDNFTGLIMEDGVKDYKYCKIHSSVTIPNEWYKD